MPDTATTITLIDACGMAGVTPLLTSEPGRGKSSMIRGLARSRGLDCWTVNGSIREPSDFLGLPVPRDDAVSFWAPRWARSLRDAGAGFLILDELSTCPPGVQNAMLAVALERMVGEDLQLPPGVVIVACANPPDQAANGWQLGPALANRFLHLTFTPTPQEFIHGLTTDWAAPPASRAIDAGDARRAASRAAVAGFLQKNPGSIHSYPATPAEASRAWPSGRTWTMTAEVLARLRDDDTDARTAAINGLIGEGTGAEFVTWLREADLPDPADVLADPSTVAWRENRPDRIYAILYGVVAHCTAGGSSVQRWQQAWGPLIAAAENGAADVAAAAARVLGRARPAGALPPEAAARLAPLLQQAGVSGKAGRAGPEMEP